MNLYAINKFVKQKQFQLPMAENVETKSLKPKHALCFKYVCAVDEMNNY